MLCRDLNDAIRSYSSVLVPFQSYHLSDWRLKSLESIITAQGYDGFTDNITWTKEILELVFQETYAGILFYTTGF